MPVATDPNTNTTPLLPPPQTFDILPPLYPLLTRLLLLPPSPTDPASTPNPAPDAPTPLSPKDLATAASSIMLKIQNARQAVSALEGMDVGLEEQGALIRELEEEVRRGEGVLGALRGRAREVMRANGEGSKAEDQEMSG